MSIDPLAEEYAYQSPYNFAENKVISHVELEGLEGVPFQAVMNADKAVNPNGVSAHVTGIAQGLINAGAGLWNAVTSPVETGKGLVNSVLASSQNGNTANMMAMDAALGTDSYGAYTGMSQSITNGVDALINGDGVARGTVIGEIGGNILAGEGIGAAAKSLKVGTAVETGSIKLIGPTGDAGAIVTKQIPEGWSAQPAKKGAGTRFSDPSNPKSNNVRVMRGDSNSPHPSQQVDYVKHTKNGSSVDVNGNKVPHNSPEAHIPKQEFKR